MDNSIIFHPTNQEEFEALKAFAKALKIKFEVAKEKAYNKEFVDKVLQGDKDIAKGKGKKITLEELNDLWK